MMSLCARLCALCAVSALMQMAVPQEWESDGLRMIGGMLMLMLGLVGEYVGRMYVCMNNAPQYVVREVVKAESGNEL